ncbi:MAG: M23 family metallopeptidase [Bdellovibrionaceae bacterium]|nr:M23 family metallopeptidase [Pseudobdellovibrionaceae bacterium]
MSILLNSFSWAQDTGVFYTIKEESVTSYGLTDPRMDVMMFEPIPVLEEPLSLTIPEGASIEVMESGQDEEGNDVLRILINGQLSGWVPAKELAEIETIEETQIANSGSFFIQPVKGRITSKQGMRRHPILKRMKYHSGTDIAAPKGTPVKAAAAGTVTKSGWSGGYGILVQLRHAGGVVTRYAHLSKTLVRKGQSVGQGTVIGRVGSTGRSTGPHLHFEKR